jgi:predicted DNA-binding ribbon-helix-helix protein
MRKADPRADRTITVERVQTGIRLERRLLKVLKALAEYHDVSLASLVEGIVLHAFEGKCALRADSIAKVRALKKVYAMDYGAEASHRLVEQGE